jgi:hypothetical protein
MPSAAIFVFDSSYPTADVALPIDDRQPHIIVSNRQIEPPPGHGLLVLEEERDVSSILRNFRSLRSGWRRAGGGRCIVISAAIVRPEQLLFNAIYAFALTRNVALFDGLNCLPALRAWRSLVKCALLGAGKLIFNDFRLKLKTLLFDRKVRSLPARSTREGGLFGMYTAARSFSLAPDPVTPCADGATVYGDVTRGWHLPAFSARRQRYEVRTTRHRLREVSLHVERMKGFEESCLIKDGLILDYPYMQDRARRWHAYPVSSRDAVKSAERGINLLPYASTYYHWLVDCVPRILDAVDDGFDFDRYPLVLPPLEPFQRQLLEVLGIVPDRHTLSVAIGEWCHIGECVYPTANFPFGMPDLEDPSGQPARSLLLRIRARLMERLGSACTANGPSRLYISRAKAGRRKFAAATETALASLLQAAGFVKVCLEDLTFSEQVRLVAGAEYIVGLHGAGLTNILFANARALIELHNPLQVRPYFAVMARELDIRYAYLIGSLEGMSPDFDNITIDLRAVEDLIERIVPPCSDRHAER